MTDNAREPEAEDTGVGHDFLTLFEAYEHSVCEWGDIVLVANDDYHPVTKLRVSSCILAMVSKPFKALFSKKYAEGQQSDGRRCEIQVKDAPVPLKRLCLLLHHQSPYEKGEAPISSAGMLELALIADKYDCHEALRLPADALLAKYERKHREEWHDCLDHLVTAAYMLDQPTHFRRFCKEMVLNEVMLKPKDFEARCLELLPSALLPSLQMQQSIAMQELSARVTTLIDKFSEEAEKAGSEQLVVKLLGSLKKKHQGLWPLNFKSHSLIMMTRSFKRVKVPIIAKTEAPKPPDLDDDWSNWGASTKKKKKKKGEVPTEDNEHMYALYRDALTDGATVVRDLCVGVCIDCIRGRECRQSHRSHFQDTVEWEDSDQMSFRSFDEDEWDYHHATNQPGYWEDAWVRAIPPAVIIC